MDAAQNPPPGGAEDVVVETIDEDVHAGHDPMEGPQNQTPPVLIDNFYLVLDFIQQYGWVLLIIGVALYFLKQRLEAYLKEQQKHNEDALYAKDPDALLQQQLKREERVRRLQEEQDAAAQRQMEKDAEKEEQKRKEKLEDWDRYLAGQGYKAKSRHQQTEQNSSTATEIPAAAPLRPRRSNLRGDDYNPMTGGGGSSGFRPAPRGGGGGG